VAGADCNGARSRGRTSHEVTSAPDYISPIIGCRVWHWDGVGLRSLNGEPWQPGTPLQARCRVCDFALWSRGHQARLSSNIAPDLKCTCGIYAGGNLEHLRKPGYERSLIYGQVLLWGTVVEHQRGWRAQYAYPHSFLLPPEVLPVTLMEIESRLEALISYDCDIFVLHEGPRLPLWKNDSGFADVGLDYLTKRASKWYAERNQGSGIKQGERIAIAGLGTAVVEEIDGTCIRAKLGNKTVLNIARKQVSWNKQNLRWETDACAYHAVEGSS
jgi:hypothetical protein